MMLGDRLIPLKISYTNLSTNRGKYSEPEDVIIDAPGWGILFWRVDQIPRDVKSDDPKATAYDFRPGHKPEDDNYSHTEIWAYRDDIRVPEPDPSKAVKKRYRQLMSERATLIKPPDV
jgi:hypothetical protein